MSEHSGDPAEPFTCDKHRGVEERSAIEAFSVLLLCPDCNARARDIMERTRANFSDIMRAVTEPKP